MLNLRWFICVVLATQPSDKPSQAQLDAHAERGLAGRQTDGWQRVVLDLTNLSDKPITGRATLFAWESQAGVRPRITLPFALTDRQVLHFYLFRPPESPIGGPYLITIEDDAGKPVLWRGSEQSFVFNGQSRRGLRVAMGDDASGNFRVGLWGSSSVPIRNLIEEWTPRLDSLYKDQSSIENVIARGQQFLTGRQGNWDPQAIALEQPRLMPDSYLGFAVLDVLMIFGTDIDHELTEPQRRALSDWVRGGGMIVFAPRSQAQLDSPFWRELTGVRPLREITAEDDRHLSAWIGFDRRLDPADSSESSPTVVEGRGSAVPQRPVHFLTGIEPRRPQEVTASYQGEPVVYSVPVGYGRVWFVAFDPDSHGGVRHYGRLWVELLNQAVRHRVIDAGRRMNANAQSWAFQTDRDWLQTLGKPFGNYPAIETLAILILCYLVIVGPVNYLVLKRREVRVWFIGTVPFLAVAFGGVVLALGFHSHGWRPATNQMGLAIVTPEGDRAFAEEFIGVYGTTSDVYRVGFARNLPVRPLGEYLSNPNGGYETRADFNLVWRDERVWLSDWRLSFWQTRGLATADSVSTGGQLKSVWDGVSLTLSNQTPVDFQEVRLSLGGSARSFGPLKPFAVRKLVARPATPDELRETDEPTELASSDFRSAAGLDDSDAKTGGSAVVRSMRFVEAEADAPGAELAGGTNSDGEDLSWPEAAKLIDAASKRLGQADRAWMFGLTKQPIHSLESPDAKKHSVTTLYVWPVEGLGTKSPQRRPTK